MTWTRLPLSCLGLAQLFAVTVGQVTPKTSPSPNSLWPMSGNSILSTCPARHCLLQSALAPQLCVVRLLVVLEDLIRTMVLGQRTCDISQVTCLCQRLACLH